jgi:hypothetical protein
MIYEYDDAVVTKPNIYGNQGSFLRQYHSKVDGKYEIGKDAFFISLLELELEEQTGARAQQDRYRKTQTQPSINPEIKVKLEAWTKLFPEASKKISEYTKKINTMGIQDVQLYNDLLLGLLVENYQDQRETYKVICEETLLKYCRD